MKKWQKVNPWIYNNDIIHGFLDPTQWPEEWSYIPRTYLHQFFRKCNTGPTTKHNLSAIWLAYYLSCPINQELTGRTQCRVTDISHSSGLLVGASDAFFTTNLDIITAAKLVQNSDTVFRNAIAKDLQSSGQDAALFLRGVEQKASQYLAEDDICGRIDICADIKGAILKKGSLAFVTGGCSVGKSKIVAGVVRALCDTHTDITKGKQEGVRRGSGGVAVVMVDGRDKCHLVSALSQVANRQATNRGIVPSPTPSTALVVAFDFTGIDFPLDVAEAVGVLARHPQDTHTNHTVLILDEANVFLQPTGKYAEHARQLDALVKNTKARLMSVLLVSAQGLPYHLLDLGMDAGISTLVIGEPSPRECLALLQRLGVGGHLSRALLDSYGGKVYQICTFLERLPSRADQGAKGEILRVLRQLARTGFLPMDDNKLARLLTKCNVCAFLTQDAVQYQVPEVVRANRAGLVPGSQLLRVLIARRLAQIEIDRLMDRHEHR
ncbi:hypothetical protein B484DRAFT_402568 [Ochromonadaceae sp. CCMP2298]|nr:hypothetical protein B484DRAFT_402568 [Ochromonadaceae sp. CCMP2298]